MARPQKRTVDYFSHDADASEGKTLTIIENNFGLEGYAAWFKLLERLAKADNHVLNCRNSEDIEFLAAKLRLQPDKVKLILLKMADLGAIDADLYSQGIIWSQNFVNRLKDVYDNRRQELPQKPVINITNSDNSIIKDSSTLETQLSSVEMQQSKLKDTKVNNPLSEISKSLTKILVDLMLENNPTAKVPGNTDKWAKEFDLMINRDNRPADVIEAVIRFSQTDNFWKANILSPGKLRGNFDQLYMKMNGNLHSSIKKDGGNNDHSTLADWQTPAS